MDGILNKSIPRQREHFGCCGAKHDKSAPADQETFITPRCEDHHYCESCIKNKSSGVKNCGICKKFFNNMRFKLFRRKNICNLCGNKESSQVLGCNSHNYCKTCFIHILSKRTDIYMRIHKCKACTKNIPNLNEIFCINNSKPLISDAARIMLMKETLDRIFETTEYMKAKKVLDLSIENEQKFEDTLNITLNNRSINYSTTKDLSLDSVRVSFFGAPTCAVCRSIQLVIGFLCNHNVCRDCYLGFCIDQIREFCRKKGKGQAGFGASFAYYCGVDGCGDEIDVPTSMVIKEMRKRGVGIDIDEHLQYFDGLG